MRKLFVLLIAHCSLLIAAAQWQPDVRLTNDTAVSLAHSNAWSAATGNTVHVAWYDNRDGNNEIYYKRSTNGGVSWGTDLRLTIDPAISRYPSLSASGSAVHIVWEDNRDGNWEIYCKHSTDGGLSWGVETRLTNNTSASSYPAISFSGAVVHVVWSDYRHSNYEIYYKRSTDGGVSWGADTRLTNDPASSSYSSIALIASVVHVVWRDVRDGNMEIYHKRSTDGGVIWGPDTRLTNNSYSSDRPSVSIFGSDVHVVWMDNRDGNWEINYKCSTDEGLSWGPDVRLTNAPYESLYPSVSSSGSIVHVVWEDMRDGNLEIYYKRSTNAGVSWGSDTRLTNNPNNSLNPSVSVSGTVVHVAWVDDRDVNYEVYYKRDPTGNPVGMINISSEIPSEFKLYQNYPNPFNPETKIKFSLPLPSKGGVLEVKLVIYDVLGREVAVLIPPLGGGQEGLKPGTYQVEWDALAYPSGVYFYRLTAGDYTDTKKMLLIK